MTKKNFKFSERGDHETRQHKNLAVVLWQDNKVVKVLSTNADPTDERTVQRKCKDGSSQSVPCPLAIMLYNMFMGGVDRSDQLRGYYIVRLKGRKMYKYIFWFLFDLAITNAFILCKNYTHLRVSSLKSFRVELAKALVGSYCSRKKPGRLSSSIPRPKRFQLADHYPLRGAKKAHRCHLCQIKYKRRRETVWRCMTCNKFLCHTGTDSDCYYEYHRINNTQ